MIVVIILGRITLLLVLLLGCNTLIKLESYGQIALIWGFKGAEPLPYYMRNI